MDKLNKSEKDDDEPKEFVEDWLDAVRHFISKPSNLRFVVLGFLIVVILPWSLISFFPEKNGTTANQIVETFGGIAGPIINLIAILLVYKSFNAQIMANNLMREQVQIDRSEKNYEYFLGKINEIRDLLNEIEFSTEFFFNNRIAFEVNREMMHMLENLNTPKFENDSLITGNLRTIRKALLKLNRTIQKINLTYLAEDDKNRLRMIIAELVNDDLGNFFGPFPPELKFSDQALTDSEHQAKYRSLVNFSVSIFMTIDEIKEYLDGK